MNTNGTTRLVPQLLFFALIGSMVHGSDESGRKTDVAAMRLQHMGTVYWTGFTAAGNILATGDGYWDKPGTVRFWDAATGKLVRQFAGHEQGVVAAAFSPDGGILATGSFDTTVRLWDTTTGAERYVAGRHGDRVRCLAFSPDGKTLVSGSDDHTVKIWDLVTRKGRIAFKEDVGRIGGLAFMPDGKTLLVGGDSIFLQDIVSGQIRSVSGHNMTGFCMAISPDQRRWASGHGGDTSHFLRSDEAKAGGWDVFLKLDRIVESAGEVRLWDLSAVDRRAVLSGHGAPVWAIAFSASGKTIASGSKDGTVRVWEVETRTLRATIKAHTDTVRSIAFSPDGKRIATGSADGTARVWNLTEFLR